MFSPPFMTLLRPSAPLPFFQALSLGNNWTTEIGPPALYVASLNKTFVTWQIVGASGHKSVQIAAYDHATQTWSERRTVGNFILADDNHGSPAIARDADGYFYVFFGSHNTTQPWSVSTLPNNIAEWTQQTPLSGSLTYPGPSFVGSTLYLFLRNGADLNQRRAAVRLATPSGGSASFGSLANLVELGADSRVYRGSHFVVGTKIHFVATRSNAADTTRQGVYYCIYNTATGALENADGSVSTASGSLPINLTTANASYRIYDHGSAEAGAAPSACRDDNGILHVLFSDDDVLKHTFFSGGVWSSPTNLATVPDLAPGLGFNSNYTLAAGASGTVEAWYMNAAGDKIRRVRSAGAGGVWSPEQIVLASTGELVLDQAAVADAHPDLRVVFAEGGSAVDADAILAKRYVYGDAGASLVSVPSTSIDPLFDAVSVLYGFESRDTTPRFVNEAPSCLLATAQGNAQADTAQQKFGSASLLLDGSGDYVQFAHNTRFSVSQGDFTVECWVRLNATKVQQIAGKRPGAGILASEWSLSLTAANLLQIAAFTNNGVSGTAVAAVASTTPLVNGTWTHVAFSRQGATWRIFINGVLEGTSVESAPPLANTELFLIGRDPSNTGRDLNGWIDEFRFTSGHARYTSAFTAPVAAFPRS